MYLQLTCLSDCRSSVEKIELPREGQTKEPSIHVPVLSSYSSKPSHMETTMRAVLSALSESWHLNTQVIIFKALLSQFKSDSCCVDSKNGARKATQSSRGGKSLGMLFGRYNFCRSYPCLQRKSPREDKSSKEWECDKYLSALSIAIVCCMSSTFFPVCVDPNTVIPKIQSASSSASERFGFWILDFGF